MATVIQFVSPCIGMLLHVTAFYLLWKKHANITMNQRIILLNLSLVEISLCLCDIVRCVIAFATRNGSFAIELFLTLFYCFIQEYFYVMVALTVDRFAQIYLNIKYDLYWSVEKTKYTMGMIWILTFLLDTGLLLFINLQNESQYLHVLFQVWIMPITSIFFLFLVIFTYTYITMKIIETINSNVRVSYRRNDLHSSIEISPQPGSKRRSGARFKDVLIPTLLISTYILFIMIPIFIFYLMKRNILSITSWFPQLMNSLFYLGCSSDAIICILFSTTFRRKFIRNKNWKRTTDSRKIETQL